MDKYQRNREQIQYVRKYITILTKLSQHLYGVDISQVNLFGNRLVVWLENEPLPQVIRRIKEMRLMVQRFISGAPIESSFLRSSKGLPLAIPSQLRDGIRTGNKVAIKLTLTLLYVSREWQCDLNPNYLNIVTPNEPDISCFTQLIPEFIRTHGIKVDTSPWTLFHLSTKQGPNGPALSKSLLESAIIPDELVCQITTFVEELTEPVAACRSYVQATSPSQYEGGCYRKVTPIPDKEGKTRLIGILDYWSQTALKPFHDSLMGNLKRFKGDMTTNQTGHGHDWSKGKKLFSYDLVSATDRFPLNLQLALVKALVGEEKGNAWQMIMTGYEFKSPIGMISFKAGQPMGAYSSWPVFTMCHHYVMFLALQEEEGSYIMLGDDIVIAGEPLARKYRSIISALGVEISDPKSFESCDFYEFAKKCYYKTSDVTPLHIGAILTARNSTEWVTAMSTLTERKSYCWPGDLMFQLTRITLGKNLLDWEVRSSLSKLYAFDMWPLEKDGTPNHKLIQFVRRVIPVPCGSYDLAASKLAKGLKGALQNALVEQLNSLDEWFQSLKESKISAEDWASHNLPGKPQLMVPLEVIYERERAKFTSLIMKISQDTLFLGIEGFSEIVKIVISDPRKLGSMRRHLVTNQVTTHLSQKLLKILQKLRDRDINFSTTPLQVEIEAPSSYDDENPFAAFQEGDI
jgi:hypothetical protein